MAQTVVNHVIVLLVDLKTCSVIPRLVSVNANVI